LDTAVRESAKPFGDRTRSVLGEAGELAANADAPELPHALGLVCLGADSAEQARHEDRHPRADDIPREPGYLGRDAWYLVHDDDRWTLALAVDALLRAGVGELEGGEISKPVHDDPL
jgi:hypothetical protein